MKVEGIPMLKKLMLSVATLVLLCGLSAVRAQEPPAEAQKTRPEEPTVREQIRERIRRAMRLPEVVQESRDAGVPEEKVREVLDTARERDLKVGEVEEIFEIENEAIRQGGNPDNFGAAVQQMKASGLRGRELADAIHAEQYARGMKKPKKDKGYKGKGKGKGKGKHRDHDGDDDHPGYQDDDDYEGEHEDLDRPDRDRAKDARDEAKGAKDKTRGAREKAKEKTKSDDDPESDRRGKR